MADADLTGTGLARLAIALDTFAEHDLSLGSVRALIYIAILTKHSDNPRLPNVQDMSDWLDMSHSGTSRMIHSLILNGYIENDQNIRIARSGALLLTVKGRATVSQALKLSGLSDGLDFTNDILSYATFAQKTLEYQDRLAIVNVKGHHLSFQPISKTDECRINAWCQDNFGPTVRLKNYDDYVQIEIDNEVDRLLFYTRWNGAKLDTP